MISRLTCPRRLAVALIVLTGLAATTAYAASLNVSSGKLTAWSSPAGCIPRTQTASADADSYIDQDADTTNYGTAAVLKVRSPLLSILGVDLGGVRRSLVRFTLPSLNSCAVTAATLRLYATASASGRTLSALRVNESWMEDTVVWDGPATTGAAVNTTSGSGWREWTVTSQVASMYAGSNHGFLIRDNTGVALLAPEQQFSSRTAASNQPQLVITYG